MIVVDDELDRLCQLYGPGFYDELTIRLRIALSDVSPFYIGILLNEELARPADLQRPWLIQLYNSICNPN